MLVLLLLWGWVWLSPLPVLFTCIQGKVENACFVLIARLKHSLFFWMPLIMHFSYLNPPSLFSVSLCKPDLVTMSVWATVLQSEFEFITALFLEVWKFPTHPNRAWPSLACLCNTRRFARLAPQGFKLLIKQFYSPAHIGAKFVFGADHKTLVGHHSNTSLFVFLDARFFRAPFCRPKMHYMCECPCIRK